MIPAEAVEAVCAFVASENGVRPDAEYVRAMLESAAPHLSASAWDDGEKAGYSNCVAVENGLQQADNPYRPTK